MFLKDLALKDANAGFVVTNCPWLKGRIMRSTQGGVTVKFSANNQPPDDDVVGSYNTPICLSSQTEVTEQ